MGWGMVRRLMALGKRLRRSVVALTFDADDFSDPLPCLWSKGLSRQCDFRGPEGYWQAPTESVQSESLFREHYADAHGLVWVRLSTQSRDGVAADLDRFVAAALPSIAKPFVLVTSDGDVSVPSELRPETVAALLSCSWLVAWYTQNHDGSCAPRLAPLPIGLDLHTPRPFTSPRRLLDDLARIRAMRRDARDLPPTILCDIGLSLASAQRIAAVQALHGCAHVEKVRRRVSQRAIWQRYANHPFVLSLEGNAVDCHRTWEALYLGSIVITMSSALDSLFADLPVVIIHDWSEILDQDNLRRWQLQYAPLTGREHVWSLLQAQSYMDRLRCRLELPTLPAAV